jgi:aminoglycoside phosphotransferase (APT) family kinase protein
MAMSIDFSKPISERLGVIERGQLQSALDVFDLGNLLDVERASEGLFGQNLFLEVDSAGVRERWVFRGAPHWPHQFSREKYFVEIVHRVTRAPVPWPFHVDRDPSLFGWSYALMPRLPGTPPSVLRDRVGEDERREVARQIAAGLAEMHGAFTDEFGEYDPGRDAIAQESSYEAWWMRSVERYRSRCLEIPDALDREDIAYIDALLADHGHALSVPFRPSVVHHDFKEGNIHVRRTVAGWKLSGIFDWMTAASGDAEQDLSRMASSLGVSGPGLVRVFLDAYRERRPLRDGARDRFRLYMLLDRLWIWEYARRNEVWFPREARFRHFARRSIDLDRLL